MKILIIGYSGSGKSTFAKRLSEHYQIPRLHIDRIFFAPNWKERDKKIVESEIRDFIKQDDWIIDGTYRKLAVERYQMCDQLFIFNFNRFKCLYGAIYRRIKYHNQNRDTIAPGCKERLNFSFFMWILHTGRKKDSRQLMKRNMEEYKDKVVVFKSRRQINNYLRKIGYQGSLKYE
ncbi:MAG: topology modulation protein [Bacillota bacterium]|nr:MAG: topology modulation protein [Bacillota bacterium]